MSKLCPNNRYINRYCIYYYKNMQLLNNHDNNRYDKMN